MTATDTPSRTELANVIDKAAEVIANQGWHRGFLYDTRQADGGTRPSECRVDIIGALNMAAHGTPRYAGSPIVHAAEQALLPHTGRTGLAPWNDDKTTTKQDVLNLLATTAAELREAP